MNTDGSDHRHSIVSPSHETSLGTNSASAPHHYSATPCRRCRNLNLVCDDRQPSCSRCAHDGAGCVRESAAPVAFTPINNTAPQSPEMSVPHHGYAPTIAPAPAPAPVPTPATMSTPVPAPAPAPALAPASVPQATPISKQEPISPQQSPSHFMYSTSTSTWAAANGNNMNNHVAHTPQDISMDDTNRRSPSIRERSQEPTHALAEPGNVIGSNDDTPARQQGKRKRTSCADCHKRKLKCDREYPACGRCRKRGVPCYYDDWSTITMDSHKTHPSRVRRVQTPQAANTASPGRALYGPLTGQPLKDQMTAYDNRAASIQHHSYAVPFSQVDEQLVWQSRRQSEVERPAQRQNLGAGVNVSQGTIRTMLRKEAESTSIIGRPGKAFETQFNGPTNPYSTLKTFPELTAFAHGAITKGPSLARVRDGMKSLKRKNKEVFNARTDAELVNFLPDEARMLSLIRDYFHAFSHIYPVVHEQVFHDQLSFFRDTNGRVSRPGFVAVLLLILSCASVMPRNEPLRFVGDSSLARYEAFRWMSAVESWLENQSEKHLTLEIFQVQCLLLVAYKVNARKVKRAWANAGSTLRAAMSAGMHCDPATLDSNMSFFDQEMRRRIWSVILELELQASIDRGMPATLQPNSYSCAPPTNIDDYDFRHSAIGGPENQVKEYTTQTSASFLISCRSSFAARSQVVSVLNDLSRSASYNDILTLDRQISNEIENLPSYTEVGKSIWLGLDGMAGLGNAIQQLQLLQLLVLMHTPYAVQTHEDSRFKYSQIACFEAAERIFDIYNHADEDRKAVLSLLRNDLSRTCISVCQVIHASSIGRGTLFTRTLRTPFLDLIARALSTLESKVLRLGTGFHLFWLVSAAYHLVLPLRSHDASPLSLSPDDPESMRCQLMAAEKVTNLYYKIMGNQEPAPLVPASMLNGGSGGGSNGTQMPGMQEMGFGSVGGGVGAGVGVESRWYGAIEQAAEVAGTMGAVGSMGNGDVDMDAVFGGGGLGDDDLWNFTSSELFML